MEQNKIIHPIKIGNVKLENNILIAPMAGITNLPFRRILDKYSPGLLNCEMISSNAIYYNDNKTRTLLDTQGTKTSTAFQMFGEDIASIEYTTKFLCDNYSMPLIDFNMGCPAPKVVKNGAGSYLLTDLSKAKQILKTIVNNSNVPVTLKMRLGYEKSDFVADKVAKIAQDVGISAITIHGRFRSQYYSGSSNLELVKKVKQSVEIPVIGNGDITSYEMAKKYIQECKVDGIMLARGIFGSPWLIEQIKCEDQEKDFTITMEEKRQVVLEHLKYSYEEKGITGIKEFRKHLAVYSKNLRNSSSFRTLVNILEDYDKVKQAIKEYFVE